MFDLSCQYSLFKFEFKNTLNTVFIYIYYKIQQTCFSHLYSLRQSARTLSLACLHHTVQSCVHYSDFTHKTYMKTQIIPNDSMHSMGRFY